MYVHDAYVYTVSDQIIATSHQTTETMVVKSKGSSPLFQGNLGSWNI